MAVSFVLYNFAKVKNSTALPPDTDVTIETGEFNAPVSVMAPQALFKFPVVSVPPYNYCYIQEFHRYYFITEWVWSNGLWVAYLTIDVLATYKSQIGAANMFILRSSAEYNPNVADTMYPTLSNRVSTCSLKASPFYSSFYSGYYVVGLINSDVNTIGATNYYFMSPTQFRSFMSNMFTSVDYMNISASEISANLQKALINPFQYVASAMWFPFDVTADRDNAAGLQSPLPIGWWTVDGSAYYLNHMHHSGEYTISVPKHPQSNTRGKWVNLAPYSTYSLEFWPWGEIPLDSAKLVDVDTLNLSYVIDYLTGVGTLRVTGDTGDGAIAVSVAQVGVPIQVAQIAMNFGNLTPSSGVAALMGGAALGVGINNVTEQVQTVVSSAKEMWNALTGGHAPSGYGNGMGHGGGGVAGGGGGRGGSGAEPTSGATITVDKVLSNIGNAINSVLADVSVSGSNGGTACFSLGVRVNAHFTSISDEDNNFAGRPLCEYRKPNDMSDGFLQVLNGDIPIVSDYAPSQNETDLVKAFLEGGFFWVNN